MEKKQYEICYEVLKRFHKAGILNHLILIGSWCAVFYKYYQKSLEVNVTKLRTRDIDFLIGSPSKIKDKIDIPELLKDLGFVVSFSGEKGFIKLDHPDLIIEFLIPEQGKGSVRPLNIPNLGINATPIRFLNFLTQDSIKVTLDDFSMRLPHPCHFALHKLIIGQRRTNKDKAAKDIQMAIDVLESIVTSGEADSIKKIFDILPSKWKGYIITSLEQANEHSLLQLLRD